MEEITTEPHIIIGVHITNRARHAAEVQQVFTEFGCNIKTRIGLHDLDDNVCSTSGVVLLEFFGSQEEAEQIQRRLRAIQGVDAKLMVFEH